MDQSEQTPINLKLKISGKLTVGVGLLRDFHKISGHPYRPIIYLKKTANNLFNVV